MQIAYKNKRLEKCLIGVNVLTAAVVAATFVMLFGFYETLIPESILFSVQWGCLLIFLAEKGIRFYNSFSKKEFVRANIFEIPFIAILLLVLVGAGRWFFEDNPQGVRHFTVGVYLVGQVVIKVCRTVVNMAATGRNPTQTLIASFLVLILAGAGLLMLPKSHANEEMAVIDALFTATSATCVTGLVVRDTGSDFTTMGQVVILGLIQLGGLGIVVFGAVIALLLGQAFSVRESVAMQDLLSAQTLGRIGKIIGFIFAGTLFIEAIGALLLFGMWDNVPGKVVGYNYKVFCSIFHSISAFCNAGFSLFTDSLAEYSTSWQAYLVFCPLIILGGLGFGVLYNLTNMFGNRVNRFFERRFDPSKKLVMAMPKKMQLQTKIALSVSAILIILGAVLIFVFEHYATNTGGAKTGLGGAFFQSVTARTAGFNTVNIKEMGSASKLVLILLMFIGGSPGSTAGGIKTVTFAVIIMTAYAALRKRNDVELFRRSIRIVIVGRAITVLFLFIAMLFASTFLLSITETANDSFGMEEIMFEAASALGTVGLTTGITGELTGLGKLIIIITMLVGRLGPLTLLATLTFNLRPVRYNYPDEPLIVG